MKKYILYFVFLIMPNIEHLARLFFYLKKEENFWIESTLSAINSSGIILFFELLVFIFLIYTIIKIVKKRNGKSKIVLVITLFLVGQILFYLGWVSPLYDYLLDRGIYAFSNL